MDPEMIARLTALLEQARGDLSGLSTDEIRTLRSELRAGYRTARGALDPATATDEQVEALREFTAAEAAVNGVLAAREADEASEAEQRQQAEAERARQLAELDEAMGDDEGEGGGDQGGQGGGEGTPGGDGTPSQAMPPDHATGVGTENVPPAPAEGGTSTPPEAPPADTGTSGGSGGGAPSGGTQQASGRRPSLGALAHTGVQAPTPPEPEWPGQVTFRPGRQVRSASATSVVAANQPFEDTEQLGQVISERLGELRVLNPGSEKHYIGRMSVNDRPHAVVLPANFRGDATGLVDEAVRRNRERKVAAAEAVASGDRRVASGGICGPAVPDFTMTVVGEAETPWIDGLPTVQGNRPVSIVPWINISQTAAAGSRPGARPAKGMGTVTAAQDKIGYGGTNIAGVTTSVPNGGHAFKDCVEIDCPSWETFEPEASFLCTKIGNFQAITGPEYVAAFDRIVHTYFNIYRDERFLAKAIARGKVLQGLANPVFGAARDLLDVIRRTATHVRNVRHAPNLGFNVVLPAFAAQMVAQDIAYSWSNGTENLRVSAAQALAMLAVEEGIFIETYNVSIGATGSGLPTVLPELEDGEVLPDWMDEIRILMYPDGSIWRQDYGELSFGLRETGMETNDFRGFEEIFEQAGFRSTDIIVLDVPLCVNGLQAGTVVKICGDGGDTSELGPIVVGPQATNEIQSLAIDATGGTFPVDWDGEGVTGVAWNASAITLKTAMVDGMSNLGADDITVSKVGNTFFFQFHGQYAGQNVPTITSSGASLTGGASTATPAVVQAGGS